MNAKKKTQKSKKTHARNIARGAISALKAPITPRSKREKWQKEQTAQLQIAKAITLIKAISGEKDLDEFDNWISKLLEGSLGAHAHRLGTTQTSLGVLPHDLTSSNLSTELHLAEKRLSNSKPLLLAFCARVKELDDAFLNENWTQSHALLRSINDDFGSSYWEIELSLAITQMSRGLEAMKSEVALISNSSSKAGRYVVFQIGTRNEPAQTPTRYKESLTRRIRSFSLEESTKTYLEYRLLNEIDIDEQKVAHILAAEQLTSGIDLFFTAIKTTQLISRNPNNFSNATKEAAIHLGNALKPFSNIIGAPLESEATSLKLHDLTRIIRSKEFTFYGAESLLEYALASMMQCIFPEDNAPIINAAPIAKITVNGISSRLSSRSNLVAGEDLLKLQLNFNSAPLMLRLGSVSEVRQLPIILYEALCNANVDEFSTNSITTALLKIAHFFWHACPEEELPSPLKYFRIISAEYRIGNTRNAINILLQISSDSSSAISDSTLYIAARLQLEIGDELAAIETMAKAGLQNNRLIPLLPYETIFQGARWKRLKGLGSSPALSICLEFYLRTFDHEKVRTFKRWAIEELLLFHQTANLNSLLDCLRKDGTSIEFLCYLFRDVCDIYTMELLPEMRGSRDVVEQRASILRKLAKIDVKNELSYLSEAIDLDEILNVNDGLASLDDSRVYVDEPRIMNIVNNELTADFQRYLNLVAAGYGISDSLADLLREMRTPTAKAFQIPKNDADDLLAEIVLHIREVFLFDPAYGLDIHLSRRIRHGTIASQIRGPLEAQQLIGHRHKIGSTYAPTERITRMCQSLEKKSRESVFNAFARFSEAIDQHITLLRDEYFQIHSLEKQKGLFDLTVGGLLLNLARSIAQTCGDISQFSKECIALFWFSLTQRLSAGQRQLEIDSKKLLKGTFEKLTTDLRSIGIQDNSLFASIQQAFEELNNRTLTISSWVRAPNASPDSKTYSMRQIVDIAVATITSQRHGFKPNIQLQAPDDLLLDTYGLSVVCDLLYVALGNVYEHSEKIVDNEVNIHITFNSDTSIINFDIVSEIAANTKTPEKETLLQGTRAKIESRSFKDSARTEGKSGLLKIAAIVLQSKKTYIKFGYLPDLHFELHFSLDYVAANCAPQIQNPTPLKG